MENTKMFDAMAQIDERLIERCLAERDKTVYTGQKSFSPDKTRRRLLIAASFLCFAMVALLAVRFAMEQPQVISKDEDLKVGFDTEALAISGVKIAVSAEKTKFNVGDDLPLSVYCVCGLQSECEEKENALQSVNASVELSYSRMDPKHMAQTVRKINDAMTSAYIWNGSYETLKAEEITIPARIFTRDDTAETVEKSEEDGVIVLSLAVKKKRREGSEQTERDSIALYYKIENNEVFLTPSEEVFKLSETAVEKLQRDAVFMPGSGQPRSLSEAYEQTAKWAAPELVALETEEDSAIAFLKLYENLLAEYRTCDLDGFYEHLKKSPSGANGEEFQHIVKLQCTRMTLEALLALDCYYDRLSEENRQRMIVDFEEYLSCDNPFAAKYGFDISEEPLFFLYRNAQGNNNCFI